MKLTLVMALVLSAFLRTSLAKSITDEAEHCCEMGRRSPGLHCNFDHYAPRNTTSEMCRSSFNFCCQKYKAQLDCTAGIAASKSYKNCWAPNNRIDYQTCCSLCNMGKLFMEKAVKCKDSINFKFPEQVRMECCKRSDKKLQPLITKKEGTNKVVVMPCKKGYRKSPKTQEECSDIDECKENTHNCTSDEKCVNTKGGYHCQLQHACPRGYQVNKMQNRCEDIDECKIEGRCQQFEICVNTEGSFRCESKSCSQPGYHFNYTTGKCEDIDECMKSPCKRDQKCENLDGSFHCECKAGFRTDNKTGSCVDINECFDYPRLCQQKCTNLYGSFRCSCFSGYKLSATEDTDCDDIDECATGLNNCLSSDICQNTHGTFHCHETLKCERGYRINENKTGCDDIDECMEGKRCRLDENCVNTIGSYRCDKIECPEGYHFWIASMKCEDIDECSSWKTRCSGGKICKNHPGGFSCECRKGYEVDHSTGTCERINMCASNPCQQHCHNNYDSYRCSCDNEYRLSNDKHSCEDVDECQERKHRCRRATCINEIGSYRCECPEGFEKMGNFSCRDIDECRRDPGVCGNKHKTCVNTFGSFECANTLCDLGYKKDLKTKRCKLMNREICYPKVGSNEIDASSNCKIPVYYNHTYYPYEYKEIPRDGKVITSFKFNPIQQFEPVIKYFEAKPAHEKTKTVKLAMKNDFKITIAHPKHELRLMRALEGPQQIQIYIWIKPKYGEPIGEKIFIFPPAHSFSLQ